MSRLLPLFLLLAAALCFIAGYLVGTQRAATSAPKSPSLAETEKPSDDEAIPLAEPVESVVETAAEAPPVAPSESTVADSAAQAAQAARAARAEQRTITLTDTQQRSIEAELLEVSETHLKVRRQSDFRVVQVPVDMLSPEDRAFATYLFEKKNPAAKPANEQMILDEIFGGF